MTDGVAVLGIRHHGPGSARSVVRESGKFAGRDEGIEAFGLYVDRLVRTAEGWRFAQRRFELKWLHRVPILPVEAH